MSTHRSTVAAPEQFELRYCFLCDEEGPHFSAQIDGDYVFQCTSCFATHSEPLPPSVIGTGSGRHRAA